MMQQIKSEQEIYHMKQIARIFELAMQATIDAIQEGDAAARVCYSQIMPGIWLDTFGFENSELFQINEKGCETFVNFPQKLFVK